MKREHERIAVLKAHASGYTPTQVAKITGVNRVTASRWIAQHHA